MTAIPDNNFASRPQAQAFDTMPVSRFLTSGQLESIEQRRRFELLRLAFFALKLRKLEQRFNTVDGGEGAREAREAREPGEQSSEQEFRRNLLRHVIFHQVLTLIKLDAREQALQIITACRQ